MKKIVILALLFCASTASVWAQNTDAPYVPATCKCSAGWRTATKDSIVAIPCLKAGNDSLRLLYNYRNCVAWFPFNIIGDLNSFRDFVREINVGNIGDTARSGPTEEMTYSLSIDFDSTVSSPQVREATRDFLGYKKINAVIHCIPTITAKGGDDTAHLYKESRFPLVLDSMKLLSIVTLSDSAKVISVQPIEPDMQLLRSIIRNQRYSQFNSPVKSDTLLVTQIMSCEGLTQIIHSDHPNGIDTNGMIVENDTITIIDPITGCEVTEIATITLPQPKPPKASDPIVGVSWKDPDYKFDVRLPKDLNFRLAGKTFLRGYNTQMTGSTWIDSFVIHGYSDTLRVEPGKKYTFEVYIFQKEVVSLEEAYYYVSLKPNTIPLGVSLSTLIANKTILFPKEVQDELVLKGIPVISFGTPSTSTINGECLFVTFYDDGAQFGHLVDKSSYNEVLDKTYALVRLVQK
ncbi:MAG: hypothetical protein WCG55_03790 [bacterium]